MSFDPKTYKMRKRKPSLADIVSEHGYWMTIKGGEKEQYFLHKTEHNLADTILRAENTITGKPGESLRDCFRLLSEFLFSIRIYVVKRVSLDILSSVKMS